MPRKSKSSADDALRTLVDQFSAQLVALAERRVIQRLEAALGGQLAPARSRRVKVQPAQVAPGIAQGRAATTPKTKVTRPCPVPGCGKPGRGPRFRWLCDDHKGMSRSQWLALKAGKAAQSSGAAAKAPAKPAKDMPSRAPKAAPKVAAPVKANGVKAKAKGGNGRPTSAKPVTPAPAARKTVAPPARKTSAPAARS